MKKVVSIILMLMCIQVANFASDETQIILKKGMMNEQVKGVQQLLEGQGYYTGSIDGIFGQGTQEAIIVYQENNGLSADGIVGKETFEYLFGDAEHTGGEASLVESQVTRVTLAVEDVVSRAGLLRTAPIGAYLDWWTEISGKLVFPDDEFLIQDFETGRYFNVVAIAGTKHMDVEALTAADAQVIRELWGGDYSWDRRAVIAYLDGVAVAASLNGMPHAGRDDLPYKDYVSNRSEGYGYGYNYDKVKGNDFEGVICLHFKNSTLHKNAVKDVRHQAAIKQAAGLK